MPRNTEPKPKFLFSIGKKFIDLFDDLLDIIRHGVKSIPEIIAPIAGGTLSAVLLFAEGWGALKELGEAYENENIRQRKSRMLTSTFITALAGAGIGFCAAIIAAALGATVAIGITSMVTLVTTAVTLIYSLALARQIYTLSVAIEEEKKAQAQYEATLVANLPRLDRLRAEMENARTETERAQIQAEYSRREQEIENCKNQYQQYRNERLQAERKVAFKTCEVLASASVLTGTILAVGAFVGLSVASMGILPLACIIAGVVVGLATKLFEYFDKKNNYSITTRLRNLFFGSKMTPEERANFELNYRARQMQTQVINMGMNEAHIIEEFAHGNLPEAKKIAAVALQDAENNHRQLQEEQHPTLSPTNTMPPTPAPVKEEDSDSDTESPTPHINPHE